MTDQLSCGISFQWHCESEGYNDYLAVAHVCHAWSAGWEAGYVHYGVCNGLHVFQDSCPVYKVPD